MKYIGRMGILRDRVRSGVAKQRFLKTHKTEVIWLPLLGFGACLHKIYLTDMPLGH
jgi:hypothetical protein